MRDQYKHGKYHKPYEEAESGKYTALPIQIFAKPITESTFSRLDAPECIKPNLALQCATWAWSSYSTEGRQENPPGLRF